MSCTQYFGTYATRTAQKHTAVGTIEVVVGTQQFLLFMATSVGTFTKVHDANMYIFWHHDDDLE